VARYPLYVHPEVDAWIAEHPGLRRRADWLFAELAARGVAGRPKGVVGDAREVGGLSGHRWRRSGLGGFDYYAWWFEAGQAAPFPASSRVVRAIRPHDLVEPLAACAPDRFRQRRFEQLQPLTDEQLAVVRSPAQVRLAVGHPGTGKTGALLYSAVEALRRRSEARLLYVTLSAGLADDARLFLEGLPELEERVEVCTYDDLLRGWGQAERKAPAALLTDEAEERAFLAFLRDQPRHDLTPWQRADQALWAEVRAHLVGRALPEPFQARGQPAAEGPVLDQDSYLQLRQEEIGISAARTAWRLGQRFMAGEQRQTIHRRAWQVLERLRAGKLDGRLRSLDGLIVDELQDLTLLQQAVLIEAVRRLGRLHARQPCFVAAGDESQIVHPSGFDWGVTKDLLRERLEADPAEFELHTNQRSPSPLVEAANRTARLYDELPRTHRPQARVEAAKTEAENGRVYLVEARSDSGELLEWLGLLRETPGSAVVCADSSPEAVAERLGPDLADLLYSPALLKGLDRDYVVVWQASRALGSLRNSLQATRARGERLPYFAARRAIDEFRVAVSRSTETLVFLDLDGAGRDPLLDQLLDDRIADQASPRLLSDALAARSYDPLERALAYFQEADDLLEADLARAQRALDRADGALANLRDPEARRQALRRRIEARRRAAARLLERRDEPGCLGQVAEQLRQAEQSYRELGDETHARQYALLVERFETTPPGAASVPELLPSLFSRYVATLAELPAAERRARIYGLPREWREELSALEWTRPAPLREVLAASEALAGLSAAASDRAAAEALRERLALLLTSRQRWHQALEVFEALTAPPPRPLAHCCEQLGRYAEAARWYERAGDLEAALGCFRQAGCLPEAARLAASLGRADLAAALAALQEAERLVGQAEQALESAQARLEPAERLRLAERLRAAAARLSSRNRRERQAPAEAGPPTAPRAHQEA
jgi:hypothetical protein